MTKQTSVRLLAGLIFLLPLACADKAARGTEPPPPAPTPPGWTRLFDGLSLRNWMETDFGGQGTVEVRDGTLVLGMGNDLTGVTWTGDFPRTNFEISLQAMRLDGHDFFCGLTFPVKDSFCSLIVGGWGGSTVGLSSVDGLDASENETTRTIAFEDGRWYTIVVQVKDDSIKAWIDERRVISQPLAGRKFSVRTEVGLSRPFGIASWRTTAALRDIRMRQLEDGKVEGQRGRGAKGQRGEGKRERNGRDLLLLPFFPLPFAPSPLRPFAPSPPMAVAEFARRPATGFSACRSPHPEPRTHPRPQ